MNKKLSEMKKIMMTIIALMCIMTSCDTTAETTNSRKSVTGGPTVTRALGLKDFSSISLGGAKIKLEYRQAGDYSVKVTSTEERIEMMNIYVDNGCLRVENKKKNVDVDELDKLKIEVSSPLLKELAVSGMAEARLWDITGNNDLRIGMSGMSSVKTESITTGNFTLDCSGVSSVTLGRVNGKGDVRVSCGGSSDITTGDMTAKNFTLDCSGVSSVTLGSVSGEGDVRVNCGGSSEVTADNVKASAISVSNSGMSSVNIRKSSGTSLTVMQSGSSDMKMDFKGQTVKIDNSGTSDASVSMECDSLSVNNSGASDVTLSGTADDVNIYGSGMSSVNTKKLNKY